MGKYQQDGPTTFVEWAAGTSVKSMMKRAEKQQNRAACEVTSLERDVLRVEVTTDDESGKDTLRITYPRNGASKKTPKTMTTTASKVKKVTFDAVPRKSALKKTTTVVEEVATDSSTEVDSSEPESSEDETTCPKSKQSSSGSEGDFDSDPHHNCKCIRCVRGRQVLRKQARRARKLKRMIESESETSSGSESELDTESEASESEADMPLIKVKPKAAKKASKEGPPSESESGDEASESDEPKAKTKPKKNKPNTAQGGKQKQKQKQKQNPKPVESASEDTTEEESESEAAGSAESESEPEPVAKKKQKNQDGGGKKKGEAQNNAKGGKKQKKQNEEDQTNDNEAQGKQGKKKQEQQSKGSRGQKNEKMPSFPQANPLPHPRAPYLTEPIRAEVMQTERVLEGPHDPQPNAFYDAQNNIVRIYHGPVYGGNSNAVLYPHRDKEYRPLPMGMPHPTKNPHFNGFDPSQMPRNSPRQEHGQIPPPHAAEMGMPPGPPYGMPPPDPQMYHATMHNQGYPVGYGGMWQGGPPPPNGYGPPPDWHRNGYAMTSANGAPLPSTKDRNAAGNNNVVPIPDFPKGKNNPYYVEIAGKRIKNGGPPEFSRHSDKAKGSSPNNASWGDGENKTKSPDKWSQPKTTTPQASQAWSARSNGNNSFNNNNTAADWSTGPAHQQTDGGGDAFADYLSKAQSVENDGSNSFGGSRGGPVVDNNVAPRQASMPGSWTGPPSATNWGDTDMAAQTGGAVDQNPGEGWVSSAIADAW